MKLLWALASLAVITAVLLTGCAQEAVEEPFEPSASHEDYRTALERLDLHETALGEDWVAAGEAALDQPAVVELPFEERSILDPRDPEALGYEFPVSRGRAVTISMETEVEAYFADLFRVEQTDDETQRELVLVASRPEGDSRIRFEPRRDGRYLLRIQPELLRGGRVAVRIAATASLAFPVEGADPGDIWSFYGDSRDGGFRKHEGVDIFAPRGTHLLAASDSVVARVGERDRGGNVITLYDEERDLLLYYAHLEEQLVEQGQRVSRGDVIGTMGNTGNAITTPPHLHIGIYQGGWRNDVDPWDYFVNPPRTRPDPPRYADLTGQWLATTTEIRLQREIAAPAAEPRWVNRNPLLRPGEAADTTQPSPRSGAGEQALRLAAGEAVQVLGSAEDLLRVRTAGGAAGYVPAAVLSARREPVVITESRRARDVWSGDTVAELAAGSEVVVLGRAHEGVVVAISEDRVGILPGLPE